MTDNDMDLLAQELGELGDQPPMPDSGEYAAIIGKPKVIDGRSEKGPWAKLVIPFELDDDDQRARLAPRKPMATYGYGDNAHFLDVVEDPNTTKGYRLASEADREGANWKLKRIAKAAGVPGGALRSLLDLEGSRVRVNVVQQSRKNDPEVKDAVVTRIMPA